MANVADSLDVNTQLKQYRQAVSALEASEVAVMTALEKLKTVAGGSTFISEGQHYQIRKRQGKTYLCELAGPPKGRPKKIRIDSPLPNTEITEVADAPQDDVAALAAESSL